MKLEEQTFIHNNTTHCVHTNMIGAIYVRELNIYIRFLYHLKSTSTLNNADTYELIPLLDFIECGSIFNKAEKKMC